MTTNSGRRVLLLFMVAVGFIVLCFSIGTALSISADRNIEGRATELVRVVGPTIRHLTGTQAAMRRFQVLLDTTADRLGAGVPLGGLPDRMSESQGTWEQEWASLLAADPRAAEIDRLALRHDQVEASLGRVLDRLGAHDAAGAERILNDETAPLVDRFDYELQAARERNIDDAIALDEAIVRSRVAARRLAIAFDGVSAALAIGMAVAVRRLAGGYLQARELRLSDLERFTDQVAHDVRSPLASVEVAVDLARKGTLDREKHDAVLLRASRTVQRVGQLVDGLLLLARAGRTPPPGVSANARDVVTDVIATVAPLASARDVKVEAERLDSSTVACSPGVLTSVVSNLLDNAVKHMGDAPLRQVRVRTAPRGRVTRIEVEDSGPGLTDEMRARVFEPYVRGTTTDSSGLGLGLAMVRRMVEAHGGQVGVDTGRIGSLFWVELPTISAGVPAQNA